MRTLLEKSVPLLAWAGFTVLAGALAAILGYIVMRSWAVLHLSLLFGDVAPIDAIFLRHPVFDGLFPAVAGTFLLVLIAVLLAVPVGMAAGIYLAEYAGYRMKSCLSLLFDILAGLPSVVVGLAGFSLTILLHKVFPGKIGPCLLLSALALCFLILPYLIRTTQTALESVPLSLRQTAPALGATKLQNICKVLLPSKLTDILGGIILAVGRAAEDTAVIMLTGVVASAGIPRSLFEQFEALPFYIYYISSQYTNAEELQTGFGAAMLLLVLCGILFLLAFFTQQTLSRHFRR
ncbi:PstA family ABC transporter permease [Desulforhopalus singaporensis]|uniref:Phosphate ABC transporter membrane protein 2, PhoT family n=1 Tax=Desulforhopalus singaporensis TaxID=91360 RepID=A0A1H0URQ1_9BACT|nr:ABC transporter permease subunit [Desulforhopalus singaporensis]SDP68763.1 phosphate ABC transporter membrane protein 2, PhoT family [Desulforhopalus singaporensis]